METLVAFYENHGSALPYVVAGGAVIATGVLAHRVFSKGLRPRGPGKVKAPPDTPLIYQFPRGPYAPSYSPFPIKLETFCRLAKIEYLVDTTGRFSSRDKIPWMTYNDHVVEDSQMCIEFLRKKVGVDVNEHLTKEQRAVAEMIRVTVDEHLYWCAALFRWVFYDESFPTFAKQTLKIPYPILRMTSNLILNEAKGQGIGRHSKQEVRAILMSDLQCLSDFLGNKRYLMGDKMCETDCSLFGILSQFLFHHFNNSVVQNLLEDKFLNLHQYTLRVKEDLWPDWEDRCKS